MAGDLAGVLDYTMSHACGQTAWQSNMHTKALYRAPMPIRGAPPSRRTGGSARERRWQSVILTKFDVRPRLLVQGQRKGGAHAELVLAGEMYVGGVSSARPTSWMRLPDSAAEPWRAAPKTSKVGPCRHRSCTTQPVLRQCRGPIGYTEPTDSPPQSSGATSASVSENVHWWPAKSSAWYCRSP
jgi:hypothetical protein